MWRWGRPASSWVQAGEDWVNGGSMYTAYKEAEKVFDFLRLGSHIAIQVHLRGKTSLRSALGEGGNCCGETNS
ncbi:MAG: hypothetical protein HFH80_00545 [Lachnospiraceae bacterium]|nr:hypothetical protein [Lachnospiraceae bacterium]